MGSQAIQFERTLNIKTPLGENKLLLTGITGYEGISQMFRYQLDLVSEDANVDFKDIVGKNVTVAIRLFEDGKNRYINGYVSRFAQAPTTGRMYNYTAEVVPWLWFLTRDSDCRIFQNKTIPQIVKDVFQLHGFQDFQDEIRGPMDQWEYCVQYRETSYNFISRLFEEEGIFYYFSHEDGKHVLHFSDQNSVFKELPEGKRLRYERSGGSTKFRFDEDVITDFKLEEELRPGKYTHTDYNFITPHTDLLATTPSVVSIGGNERFEIYDYPGGYEKKSEGEAWSKVRITEEEVPHRVGVGEGMVRAMTAGYKFELFDAIRASLNQNYLLTEVRMEAREAAFHSGEESECHYHNQFRVIPFTTPYRPPRVTPKPHIHGMQTAWVVGPAGEEIWVDKYGRIKVHFHWDRLGKKDGNDTCWIRVAQPWAAKNWGHMWVPRIGQEVVVDFLEGDPDRPLVRCGVYNDDNMPPYQLPDHQTVSTMKSRSSKGGSKDNYNEIRFEDKKGSEQFFIHAEKDFDLQVRNEYRERIRARKHIIVEKNQIEKCNANRHIEVRANHVEKIGGNMSLTVGGSQQEKVGMKYAQDVGQEIHLKAGMKVVIEAGVELTIKGAGGFVKIDPSGVTIMGTMVKINSGGAPGTGSGSSPDSPESPDIADDGSRFGKM